jgi:hypothetical protein
MCSEYCLRGTQIGSFLNKKALIGCYIRLATGTILDRALLLGSERPESVLSAL